MGQKTHPIGLRVGIHRKWVTSWYDINKEKSSLDYSSLKNTVNIQGIISARGGMFISGRQDFLINLLSRYTYTKLSTSSRLRPVDFRFYKGLSGHRYGFIIYTKFVTYR